MEPALDHLTRLYAALLKLYPRAFREEFAEEMQEAFSQAAQEASTGGFPTIARLCLNELLDLPGAVLQAYERTSSRTGGGAAEWVRPGEQSWRELVLALAVFLLPASTALLNAPQGAPATAELRAAFLFVLVMVGVGWFGGFPLWSLPYVGLVLVIAGYLHLFLWIAGLVNPLLIANFHPGPWDHSTYLLLQVAATGMLWLMLFCLTLLVVAVLVVFNRFQPLLARVRYDWTLLSYVLYGESLFALLVFESRKTESNYLIASLLLMAAGLWLYLRSPAHWQRMLALLGCLTLAVGVAFFRAGPLTTLEAWLSWEAPSEAGRLLLSWIGMMAALLLPGLLARLGPGRASRLPSG